VRSYQFREYGQPLEAVDADDPRPTGAEVVVRTLGCGVCHSDLHVWEGHYDLGDDRRLDVRGGRDLPFTLGHEIAGEVVTVGPDAEGVEPGTRAVVFPWIGCGSCDICRRDEEHLCLRPRGLGTFRDGGFSDRVVVPHPRYLFDYGDAPADLACTYACSGLASYSALEKVAGHRGRHTVIVGAGGVGLAGVSVAKATSDREVIVVDIDPDKLEAARRIGADHVVDGSDRGAAKIIKDLTDGGPLAVVDCVGSEETASLGLRVLPRSGTLVILGMLGGSLRVALPLMPLKDLTIRGSYLGSLAEMGSLMELVREGRVAPIPRTTRQLSDAQRTLDDLAEGTIVGRVVLTP
jgi:D-arabinose 1-dehydrogenase-like Zn-dependent alcohol dehydrogenase